MRSRHIRLSAIAAGALVFAAVVVDSPSAHATPADDQFLTVIANLGLEFATSDDAIEAGNNVCDIVAEGSANNVDPVQIRSDVINSMLGEGLTEASAAQLMWGAVDAYCPQYNPVVGD